MTTTRFMRPVWEFCRAEAAARRVPISTYVADVMALHANRADLIQELTDTEELLPAAAGIDSPCSSPTTCSDDSAPRTTTRLMRPVWEFCRAEAAARRVPISTYVADVMALHANRTDLIQELTDTEELLPLAI